MAGDPIAGLRTAIDTAVATFDAKLGPRPTLERPPQAELGDYSTNAAMLLASSVGAAPREIAERLAVEIPKALGDDVDRIEVAGPGFVNLFMSDGWHRRSVAELLADDSFGCRRPEGAKILLEFVSANPTGPLTAAGGRGAAYGDSLGRVLQAAGAEVSREYYLNDAGTQIRNFAASIAARIRGEELPEDGYAGEYIAELAAELAGQGVLGDDLDGLARAGTEAMRTRIAATLERFGVRFDTWTSERDLLERGVLRETIGDLESEDHVYQTDGATWFRTTELGDDKDRVLIRSDGEPTYFATDVAYHRDKLARGAELMIVPLGADHHGYVPRMRAAVEALSGDPDRYEAPIMQLVNIVEGGVRARMSKRAGDFVTLDELIDDIGADAARWFLTARSHDTALDLDLDLARKASQENPVYYVQYAHARITGIIVKAERERARGADDAVAAAGALAALEQPCEPAERALVRRLLELPAEVAVAADRRAPHRLCAFATATAADFHAFYRDCRVVGADHEAGVVGLEAARLGVSLAAKRIIATTLGLVGVGAPERM